MPKKIEDEKIHSHCLDAAVSFSGKIRKVLRSFAKNTKEKDGLNE